MADRMTGHDDRYRDPGAFPPDAERQEDRRGDALRPEDRTDVDVETKRHVLATCTVEELADALFARAYVGVLLLGLAGPDGAPLVKDGKGHPALIQSKGGYHTCAGAALDLAMKLVARGNAGTPSGNLPRAKEPPPRDL